MITKITLSLLEKLTDNDEFIKKSTASIDISKINNELNSLDELIQAVLNGMFEELKQKTTTSYDYIGIWIKEDEKEYSNAIELSTLYNIEKYGERDIDSLFEFFKMTLEKEES